MISQTVHTTEQLQRISSEAEPTMGQQPDGGQKKSGRRYQKDPLFHIVKRTDIPTWKSMLIRAGALIAALILCAVIIVIITGQDPLEMYKHLFNGSFKTPKKFWGMLQELSLLLCISLAVTPAFKMRFWNIGAEGQVLMGGLGALMAMKLLGDDGLQLPNAVVLPVTIIASIVFGALWAVVPAVFKAYWNTNETLFTLMMNYIAIQIIRYIQIVWSGGSTALRPINGTGDNPSFAGWLRLPADIDPSFTGKVAVPSSSGYLLNILIVAVLTVIVFLYMRYSKQGYEISVVGESENTARYGGINVKKVVIRTMIISGVLCGIAGLLIVAGTDHIINDGSAKGYGYTAIIVSWLAKFNPFYMVLTAFLVIFLKQGASELSTRTSGVITDDFANILIAIIILFIIGCEFFINYRIMFRTRKHKEAAEQ